MEDEEVKEQWKPTIVAYEMTPQILVVARDRIDGSWRAYIGVNPMLLGDRDAEYEKFLRKQVLDSGDKVAEDIARAMFPNFREMPYAR